MKAYLFDMDGTITDTDILWGPALLDTLSSMGLEADPVWIEKVVYGRAWRSIYADLADRFPSVAAIPSEEFAHKSDAFFKAQVAKTDVRIHGTIALLRRLNEKDAPCAVVSGSTAAQIADALAIAGVSDCFKAIISSDDCAHGKPDPEGFLKGAAALGAKPEECTVFEDSTAGITAGKAAGMRVVALKLPNHPPQDVSLADLVLPDLSLFKD